MTAITANPPRTPQCESAQSNSNHNHCTSSPSTSQADTLMEEHPFFATTRNRFRRYRAVFEKVHHDVDLRLMIRQGPPGGGGPPGGNNPPGGPPSPPGPPGGNHNGPPGSPGHTSSTDTTTTSTATENVTVTNTETTTSTATATTTSDSSSSQSSSQQNLYTAPAATANSQTVSTTSGFPLTASSPSTSSVTSPQNPSSTSSTSASNPTTISTISGASNNKVTGPIVGGLLGALALFTILFAVILRRRRRAKQRPASFGDFDGAWVNRLNSRQLGTTGSGPREVSMARSLPASIVAPRVLHAGTQEGQMIYNAGLVNPFANPNTSVATLSTAPATHGHNNNDNGETSDDGNPIPNPFANAEIPLTPPSRARSSFAAVRSAITGRPQSQSTTSPHPDYDEFPSPPTPVDPFDPGRGVDTLRLRGSDGARYKALDAIV